MTERWRPGDHVVLREIWRGRVWSAYPAVVVDDAPEHHLFFIPTGTDIRYAVDRRGQELRLYTDTWDLAEHRTARSLLAFSWPDRRHSVLAFWDADWNFAGWYVNVETPLARSTLSYDYVDHCLDVLIPPDRSAWAWKDEDELQEAVRRGIFSPADARGFRDEGKRAARRIIEGDPPFDRDWSTWRPDPAWTVPRLPDGWDRVEEG